MYTMKMNENTIKGLVLNEKDINALGLITKGIKGDFKFKLSTVLKDMIILMNDAKNYLMHLFNDKELRIIAKYCVDEKVIPVEKYNIFLADDIQLFARMKIIEDGNEGTFKKVKRLSIFEAYVLELWINDFLIHADKEDSVNDYFYNSVWETEDLIEKMDYKEDDFNKLINLSNLHKITRVLDDDIEGKLSMILEHMNTLMSITKENLLYMFSELELRILAKFKKSEVLCHMDNYINILTFSIEEFADTRYCDYEYMGLIKKIKRLSRYEIYVLELWINEFYIASNEVESISEYFDRDAYPYR